MTETQQTTPLTFAVDLQKSEYVTFFKMLGRYDGAYKLKRIGCGLLCAAFLYNLYWWWEQDGAAVTQDGYFWILCAAPVLAAVVGLVLLPHRRQQIAAKTFDLACETGQIFAGEVTVTAHDITKTTPSGVLQISFSERILYFETADMQVFVNTAGRAIVLPARCMTKEDADAVRMLARAALPPPFFRVFAQTVPARTERMTLSPPAPAEPLYKTHVQYREAERQVLVKELTRRAFFAGVYPYVGLSFAAALLMGSTDGFLFAAVTFWGLLALSVCLVWFSARRRYRRIVEEETFGFTFSFTDEAITLEIAGKGKLLFPWNKVQHAIEGEDAVEFTARRQYVYIPKRCIEDIDTFRTLVQQCRQTERNG